MSASCYIIARLKSPDEFEAVRESGVNAVSIDCYDVDNICNASSTQYDALKAAQVSHADITALKAKCDAAKIDLIGTPHSHKDAIFLAKLGCAKLAIEPQYLIITEMINSISKLGKPIILRLGATSWEAIGKSFYSAHCGHHVTMLHTTCTSSGRLDDAERNLALIPELIRIYPKCIVGYSNATRQHGDPSMCYGLGARVYEQGAEGIQETVEYIRWCETMLGSVIRKIQPSEEKWREVMEERE